MDDLKELKQDVKDIKKMLHNHIIDEMQLIVKIKTKVETHAQYWAIVGVISLGFIAWIIKDWWTRQ